MNHIIDDTNIIDDFDYIDYRSNEESSSELDSEYNTENEDLVNYLIGIIASIFGYSSNDGDSDSGDSSTGYSLPADSGIHNTEENSWFYSLICKILWVIDKIMLKQFHDFCGTSIEYTLSLINHMSDILGYMTTWSINHWGVYLAILTLYCFIRYTRYVIAQINEQNKTVYTILYSISAFHFAKVSQIREGLENSNSWDDLVGVDKAWEFKENNHYLKRVFKKLVRQLGLRSTITRNNDFFIDNFSFTEMGRGLKCLLLDRGFCSAITQVRTCTFDKSNNKFVWGMFNILVLTGIGVVVWYRYVQCDNPFIIPQEIAHPLANFHAFKNPEGVINGYKRVTFLINKDIMNTVLSTFMHDPTFTGVFNFNHAENLDNNIATKHVLASVGTAIMVASFIATKALVLPTQ